jgi:hypothetical protein
VPRITRRQTPPSFANYRKYKPFLRTDFLWRCCYCGISERHWGGQAHFAVDHFRPKSIFPDLEIVYSNLYYACDSCNRYKRDTFPSAADTTLGRRFFDACADLSRDHFRLVPTGDLTPLSPCGDYSIRAIRLNRRLLIEIRRERKELVEQYRLCLKNVRELKVALSLCPLSAKPRIERALQTLSSYLAHAKKHLSYAPID